MKNSKSGFTLIELLVVIGVFIVLGAVVFISLGSRKSSVDLTDAAEQIVTTLRQAQSDSMAQKNGAIWGVHFSNVTTTAEFYSLFSGSYATGTIINHVALPNDVEFSTTSVPSGSSLDITFNQVSGAASASTSIILNFISGNGGSGAVSSGTYLNGYSYARAITVNSGQASGTQTNFPMLFSGTYSWLAASSSGGNIQKAVTVPNSVAGKWGSGYSYARAITVNSGQASGTQTNFPMLFSGTYSWLAASSSAGSVQKVITAPNGGQEPADLTFATSSANCGTANLNFETESYTPTTGAIVDWVNVPSLSVGTVIYACYDATTVTTDQSHPSSTWDSNYKGVWHFGGSTISGNDSTANGHNGTIGSYTGSTGQIGQAININSAGTGLKVGSSADFSPGSGAFTISMWADTPTGGTNYVAVGRYNGSGSNYWFGESATAHAHFSDDMGSVDSSFGFSAGVFAQIVAVYDGSGDLIIYANGVQSGITTGLSGSVSPGGNLTIGNFGDISGFAWPGLLDEVRYSNAARSPSWILTEYNNQSAPSSFYTVGSATVAPSSSQEPADLIFTSDSGCATPLNFETESYTSSTGAIVDWVKVPSISVGTTIYACYGNSAVTTDQSHPSSTWNSNYVGVYHLPNGTTLSANDSSANANNGTITGSTATTGQIDGAASQSGNDATIGQASITNAITLPNISVGNIPMTIEAWVNFGANTNNEYASLFNIGGGASSPGFSLQDRGDVSQWWFIVNGTTWATSGYHYTSGWHHVVGTYDGSSAVNIFVDGVQGTGATQSSLSAVSSPAWIGTGRAGAGGTSGNYYGFNGSLDEVRITNAVLTPSWILTEYNNQSSSSAFYALGSQTSSGGGSTTTATFSPIIGSSTIIKISSSGFISN